MDASVPEGAHGLQNRSGDHNCFLNTVIQSLWHVESFRKKMLAATDHNCSANCIFCAMRVRGNNKCHSKLAS